MLFFFRAEGFCIVDVLYGSLLQILVKKKICKQILLYFFLNFLVNKTKEPDSFEMLDPDPDSLNPDPQHYFQELDVK
jgi:hypothetical protein